MSELQCSVITCRGLHVDTLDRLPTTTLQNNQVGSTGRGQLPSSFKKGILDVGEGTENKQAGIPIPFLL